MYLLIQRNLNIDWSLVVAAFVNPLATAEVASLSHQSTSVLSNPPFSKEGREDGVNSLWGEMTMHSPHFSQDNITCLTRVASECSVLSWPSAASRWVESNVPVSSCGEWRVEGVKRRTVG